MKQTLTPRKMISVQSSIEVRMMIHSRLDVIRDLYTRDLAMQEHELNKVKHAVRELGYDIADFDFRTDAVIDAALETLGL